MIVDKREVFVQQDYVLLNQISSSGLNITN